jgi:hypothetical protein
MFVLAMGWRVTSNYCACLFPWNRVQVERSEQLMYQASVLLEMGNLEVSSKPIMLSFRRLETQPKMFL